MKNISLLIITDDRGGMMFNSRRQMKDGELLDKLIRRFGCGGICASPYTFRLIDRYEGAMMCEDPVAECPDGALCIVEDPSLLGDIRDSVGTLIRCCWGISYPADTYFTLDLAELGYRRISKEKIGTSIHAKAFCEVYKRAEDI